MILFFPPHLISSNLLIRRLVRELQGQKIESVSFFSFPISFFFYFFFVFFRETQEHFPEMRGGGPCKSEKWKKDGGLFSLGIKEMVVEVFTPAGRR